MKDKERIDYSSGLNQRDMTNKCNLWSRNGFEIYKKRDWGKWGKRIGSMDLMGVLHQCYLPDFDGLYYGYIDCVLIYRIHTLKY